MRIVAFSILFSLASAPGFAPADESFSEAKTAFEDGIRQFREKQFAEAAASFRKANRLRPNNAIQYNIGQSEAAAKRYGLAFEAFELYLAEGGDDIEMGRRDEVLKEIARLEQMVGDVKVSAPTNAMVTIDGVFRGTAPLPGKLKVAAGIAHHIEVHLNNTVIHEETVKVSRKETAVVAAMASAAQAPSSTPAAETGASFDRTGDPSEPTPNQNKASDRDPLMPAGAVTAAVGGTLLVGGVITGAMALSINSDLKAACPSGICTDTADKQKLDTRDVLSPVSTALISVGGVTAAVSLVIWILHARKDDPRKQKKQLSVLPVLGDNWTGLGVSGEF